MAEQPHPRADFRRLCGHGQRREPGARHANDGDVRLLVASQNVDDGVDVALRIRNAEIRTVRFLENVPIRH